MKEQIFQSLVTAVFDRDSGISNAQLEKIYEIAERAYLYYQSRQTPAPPVSE